MKPFEEMTKAEKMKVLEEDYVKRKAQEEIKLRKQEQRKEKLVKIGISALVTLLVMCLVALIVIMIVSAVIEKDAGQKQKCIAGAVIFGVGFVGLMWGIIYQLYDI